MEWVTEQFIESEHRNFSMINMVNELQREIDELKLINHDIASDIKAIETAKGDGEGRKKVFVGLERRIRAAEATAEEYENDLNELTPIVDTIKGQVAIIFMQVSSHCVGSCGGEREAVREGRRAIGGSLGF